jgi:hypothetical protein
MLLRLDYAQGLPGRTVKLLLRTPAAADAQWPRLRGRYRSFFFLDAATGPA